MNTKKYKITNGKLLMSFLVIFTIMFSSCEDKLEDAFLNPEAATTVEIEYLFTQTLLNDLYIWDYNQFFHKFNYFNALLETGGVSQDLTMLEQPNSNIATGHWGKYYVNIMKNIIVMQKEYDNLPDDQKAQYDVYIALANVTKCYGIGFVSDLFDDLPYSEAFGAYNDNFFPKYDTQEENYKSAIAELGILSTMLKGMTLDPDNIPVHALLAKQDKFLEGDLNKWAKFASSLRLRMAMRLSEVDAAYARTVISEIASSHAAIEEPVDNAFFIEKDGDKQTDRSRIWNAYREQRTWGGNSFYAPGYMLFELMVPTSDPRIPVFFAPDVDGNYTAIDQLPSHPHIDPDDYVGDIAASYPSMYNWTTFGGNFNMPFMIVTSSEVNFIFAEAAQRGWISGAKAYYDKALRQSIDLYYDLNANSADNTYNYTAVKPDEATIATFINSSTAAYDGTLAQIIEQKYIHFNMHKPYETWNDLRRVGLPNIPNNFEFATTKMVRVPYPGNEETTNFDNYKLVNEKSNYTTKVWWDAN